MSIEISDTEDGTTPDRPQPESTTRRFPPENPGYILLRWPLTRAPKLRRIDEASFWTLVAAVGTGTTVSVAACMAETPQEHKARMAWLSQHPPLGFPRPRWHLQTPVVRVPAGVRLVGRADFARAEAAMWSASKRALAEVAGSTG